MRSNWSKQAGMDILAQISDTLPLFDAEITFKNINTYKK
jgi:hypothetical protein